MPSSPQCFYVSSVFLGCFSVLADKIFSDIPIASVVQRGTKVIIRTYVRTSALKTAMSSSGPVQWQQQARGCTSPEKGVLWRMIPEPPPPACLIHPEAVLAETKPWEVLFYLNEVSLCGLSLGKAIFSAGRDTHFPSTLELPQG